ncbi:MAG TPA: xylulokinase [Opitutaceae bacterium]|nr:xylulokinase [Opitutaceae bacterium]
MSLYIGVDSGTQSVKAVALDPETGRVAAEARFPHRLIEGLAAGHMEQHPQEWVKAMDSAVGEVASRIDRSRVRGIGVSGQQHGFVPLDERGEVIRPAKLWCDTSTAAECALLTRKLGGPAAVIRRTGLPFLPGYTAPKVLWLKRREPANFRRLKHILLPHDYLNLHLTGNYFMEFGDASGTGFLDVRRRAWSEAAMGAVDGRVAGCLPPLSASHEACGTLRPEIAARYGFPRATIVSAGGGDNMMGAIGTGNVVPGAVTASFGTSGTIYAYARKPVVDPAGEIAAFCSSTGGWLPLLCTMNVTGVTERIRALFGWELADLELAASGAPAGSDGLTLLPYLDGERTPNLPKGTGVYFGLDRRTLEKGHLARAAIEGATLGMNYGLRRLSALGVRPTEIRLTGGGARSPLWRQIAADVFGVPVVSMTQDESAALGAALQAAWCDSPGRGSGSDLAALCGRSVSLDESTRCAPDSKRAALYRRRQELHDRLAADLRGAFEAR